MNRPFVVRNGNHEYLTIDGAWSPNEELARDFPDLASAEKECHGSHERACYRSPESMRKRESLDRT